MSIKKTNTFNYQSIASAIRLLNRKERLYQPPEMAGAVEELGRELTAITRRNTGGTTSIQFPTGYWASVFDYYYSHFKPDKSATEVGITPNFSEYDNYMICVRFRVTELNRNSKRVLFGNDYAASGAADASPVPTIYIPSEESSIAVDLYDENDNLQTITGVGTIEADTWYYAVLFSQAIGGIGSDVTLYLYDENGNKLDSQTINEFFIKPQPSQYNKQSIVFGGLRRKSANQAINVDISANECFVFAEGLSIWGVTNSITENFGL